MPYDIINNHVYRNRNHKMEEYLPKYFEDNMTSDDVPFKTFMYDLENECSNQQNRYVNNENEKISNMFIDSTLFNVICATINSSYYKNNNTRIGFIENFIQELRRNDSIFKSGDIREYDYRKISPSVTFRTDRNFSKRLSLEGLRDFYNYVYFPDNNPSISDMTLEEFLNYTRLYYKDEYECALDNCLINPEDFNAIVDKYLPDNKNKVAKVETLEEKLERNYKLAQNIELESLEPSSTNKIFKYGETSLKEITSIINEITSLVTNINTSENIISETLNGVVPRLTIFDRLSSKSMSRKMEENFENTKSNLTDIESQISNHIEIYEYLVKLYDIKLNIINKMQRVINSYLKKTDTGLIKTALINKKDNLKLNEVSTNTMKAQVIVLASNHMNVLNMLYRTKETFITVIEGQTLINSSIQAEKAALKNIKNIVNVYESALNNDFVSAFELINKLKSSGLDQNSANQLETNISNIQVLFSPSVIDEVNEIKPSTSNIEIETDENLILPVGHVRD